MYRRLALSGHFVSGHFTASATVATGASVRGFVSVARGSLSPLSSSSSFRINDSNSTTSTTTISFKFSSLPPSSSSSYFLKTPSRSFISSTAPDRNPNPNESDAEAAFEREKYWSSMSDDEFTYEYGNRRKALASYNAQGKYEEALEVAKEMEEGVRAAKGAGNLTFASAVNNVALMLKNCGEMGLALDKYIEALQVR